MSLSSHAIAQDVVGHVLEVDDKVEAAVEWMAQLIEEARSERACSLDWQSAFSEAVEAAAGTQSSGRAVEEALAFVARVLGSDVRVEPKPEPKRPKPVVQDEPSSHPFGIQIRGDDGRILSLQEVEDIAAETRADTLYIEDFISATQVDDAKARRLALRRLCPCRVKRDVTALWDAIIAMIDDPDPDVRYQVLHNLCDGSPPHMEAKVIDAVSILHDDSDKRVARAARKVLTAYRKTGDWNIM